MKAAERRDNIHLARTARAVWVGVHLTEKGLTQFLADLLDVDTSLPPEQAMFALDASTKSLPMLK